MRVVEVDETRVQFRCVLAQHSPIHTPRNRVRSPSTLRCVQITPTMRTQCKCVLLLPYLHVRIRHMVEPCPTSGLLPALLVLCPSMSPVQNTPLSPLTLTLRVLPSPTTQTYSMSFPSRYLLIPHRRHPFGAVRAGANTHNTVHTLVLVCHSCPRIQVRLPVRARDRRASRKRESARRGQFRLDMS